MIKKIGLVLTLFGVTSFAGYAYFMNNAVLEIPESYISFSVGDVDRVVLSIYELKEDPVVVLSNRSYSYKELRGKIGRRVFYRIYEVTGKWQRFSTNFNKVGFYYAVLTSRDQTQVFDSTVFLVTDIGLVFFADAGKTVLCTMKTTSEILPRAEVFLIRDGEVFLKAETDDQGLLEVEEDFDSVIVKKENSYTVSELHRPYYTESSDRKLFLVTDRPIYKPKDTVNFKGQLLKRDKDLYTALGTSKVEVVVSDPKDNQIYEKTLNTDELGGFWDSLKLAETAAVGVYRIKVFHEGNYFYDSFLVEEYRKPEYKVEIETQKEEYIAGENLQATVRVKYFNEQPVAAASVAFYVHAYPEDGRESFLVFRGYEIANEDGEVTVSVKVEEGFQGRYSIQAIVTDESQRQIEQEKMVYIHADNVKITVDNDYIFTKPGERLAIKVKVTDLTDQPLSGEMKVKFGEEVKTVEIIDGHGLIELTPRLIGSYRTELSFRKAKKSIYIHSYSWVHGYTVSEFALLTDKQSYRVNEQISVEIFTPQKTVGVVALVGDRIYAVKVVVVQGHDTVSITVPSDAVERNLFIIFAGYSNGKKLSDSKKFKIERELNVRKLQIHFDKETYEPGEDARVVIKADEDFSFSLAIVDEAIYSMLGRKPISVEEEIYPENEYPEVSWEFAHSWFYLSEKNVLYATMPEVKTFENYKAAAVQARINVREYFPDTALWVPNLRVENGTATIRFKVPDSITTFIATGYGFSKRQIAQADGKFVVTRDFYVRPILPSFFREGDIIQIGSMVFNQSSEALETKLWIELPNSIELIPTGLPPLDTFSGLPLEDQVEGEFVIQPKDFASSRWLVHAKNESDPATITIFATTNTGLSDAVALNVPVRPFAFEREFYALEFLNGRKTLNLPEGQYKEAKVTVYSSIVPLVEKSIRKLIAYPYGCTEQTMSSFFPAIVATQMGLKIEDLDDIVRKGLMRLYKYQHYDGGWGWWQTDQSSDFMTCYVMEGLYYAKKAGFDVAESVIESGLEYLKTNLSAHGSYILDLYGVEHKEYDVQKNTDWVYLSLSSREALENAVALVKQTGNLAFIDVQDDYLVTDVQLSSVLLRSLAKWGTYKELQSKLINYLMSKKDGHMWYSTKDTAFAVLALLEVLPKIDEPKVLVSNNGRTVQLVGEGQIEIDRANLTLDGSGLVEVHVIYYERPTAEVSEGLKIRRSFYKRFEIPVIDQKTVVDAFVPISQHYLPVSMRTLNELESKELYLRKYENGDYTYKDTKMRIEDTKLIISNVAYDFERLETLNGLILIILRGGGAMVYDTVTKTAKSYFEVLDASLTDKGIVYLKDGKLWMNETPAAEIPHGVTGLSCSRFEILLRTEDRTYWYTKGGFVELPFVAVRVLEWDGSRLVADKGFYFSGNDSWTTNLPCEVIFREETWPISISAGDIIKTKIDFESGTGGYLVAEDYFPSCAQILDRYREKGLQSYSKFDYMWYRTWGRWFTATEVHEDRIAFFVLDYSSNTLSYVWRATLNGRYQLLPARAYSMYHKGLYAHSAVDVLDIGVWFEVEKSK
ncbi:MG2 domain-containing protein [Pseudothermotoga sp. U03pept]|uniref:MG2 domain-containing protein n=1 Tax=Pseudothermotoga sp. U03pept TaxID=3447012 RepID=UPI003EFC2F7D